MVSNWKDYIEESPSLALLTAVEEKFPTAIERAESPGAIAQLQRAQVVAANLREGLHRPELMSRHALDSLNGPLTEAVSQLDAFIDEGDENRIVNLNRQVDDLLVLLPIPTAPRAESEAVLRESAEFAQQVTRLHVETKEHLTNLASEVEVKGQELHQLVSGFRTTLSELEAASTSAQASIKNEADQRIAELRSEINAQKTRLDTAIQQQQESFLSDQASRTREFNETVEKISNGLEAEVNALTQKHEAGLTAIQTAGQRAVEALEGFERRAESIVAITASSGVAEKYTQTARDQRKIADFWRWVALALFCAFLIVATITALTSPLSDSEQTVEDFVEYGITRVPVVLILGALGTFAVSESGKHRRREEEAERLATELTAFRPFLTELPVERINDLVVEATRRYFKGRDFSDDDA